MKSANRALMCLIACGTWAAMTSCSGGDKIVDPSSVNNLSSKALTTGDATYMTSVLVGAAVQSIKGIRQARTPDLPAYGRNAPPCTPISTTGGTDSNNNGIPDDRTVQYTGASCTYTSNGAANTVSGSIRTQDIGGLYAFRVTYNNLVLTATKGDSVVRSTVSGSFEYRWDNSKAATSVDNSTVALEVRSSQGSVGLTRAANLTGSVATLTGSSISLDPTQTLFPSGDLTLTGQVSITASATGNALAAGASSPETFTMNVSTIKAMTALISCQTDPPFNASGEISGVVTGAANGTVSNRFSGCGFGGVSDPGTKPVGKR